MNGSSIRFRRLSPSRNPQNVILAAIREAHLGPIPRSFQPHSGVIRGHSAVNQGPFEVHSAVIPCPFRPVGRCVPRVSPTHGDVAPGCSMLGHGAGQRSVAPCCLCAAASEWTQCLMSLRRDIGFGLVEVEAGLVTVGEDDPAGFKSGLDRLSRALVRCDFARLQLTHCE